MILTRRFFPACSGNHLRHTLSEQSLTRTIESLESRLLMTVTVDAAGWTQVSPSADSRMIYVSSSTGSDANSGLSASAPVASIAKAYTLLRNGDPDWVMFKRGDTFAGSFQYFNDSGRSSQEPMVVTDYGDSSLPAPIIDAGANTAFRTGSANHDLYIMGLDFTSSTHNPTSPNYTGQGSYGFYDLGGTTDLLIEDCTFSYFVNDLTFQGYNAPLTDVSIRRNEILDSYNVGGHSEGLYAESITNLTIQDNIFDHDGWNELVPNAGSTIYNHDCYLHSSNSNCVVTGNTFADASSFGLEARAGGIVDDNLFINDPYGFAFGLVNGSTVKAGGVSGEAIGNVVIQPRPDATGWGIGAMIGNLAPGGNTVISNNIFADAPGDDAAALSFAPGNAVSNPKDEAGLHSLLVSDNTSYGWGYGVSMSAKYVDGGTGADSLSDVVFLDNNFQNNVSSRIVSHGNPVNTDYESWTGNTYSDVSDPFQWFNVQGVRTSFTSWQKNDEPTATSQVVSFVDPTRTVDSYMASIGLSGGESAYIAAARDLSTPTWNPVYMAGAMVSYLTGGFTIATPAPVSAPADPPQAPAADPTAGNGSTPASGAADPTMGDAPTTDPTPAVPQIPMLAAANPPSVSRVVLNYGNTHHTALNSIMLAFSEKVTSATAMVSLVENTPTADSHLTTFVSNPSGDGKNWLITLFGLDAIGPGSYTLTIHGASVTNADGQAVGGDQTTTFTVASNTQKANRIVSPKKIVKKPKVAKVAKAAAIYGPMLITSATNE